MLKRWNFLKTGFYEGIKVLYHRHRSGTLRLEDDSKEALRPFERKELTRQLAQLLNEINDEFDVPRRRDIGIMQPTIRGYTDEE